MSGGSTRRRTAARLGPVVVSAAPADVLAVAGPALSAGHPAGAGGSGGASDPAGRAPGRVAPPLLVRRCAARVTGLPLAALSLVQRCAECGSTEHGKPAMAGIPELQVSLAHRRGAVVAAAGWSPVGVDVELPGTRGSAPLPDVLAPAERAEVRDARDPSAAFLRLWVRKECLVKLGVTTLDQLADVDLAGGADRRPASGGTRTRYGRWHLLDWVDARTGAVVAAAGQDAPVRAALPPAAPPPAR